jgi:cytochrome c peroxidase
VTRATPRRPLTAAALALAAAGWCAITTTGCRHRAQAAAAASAAAPAAAAATTEDPPPTLMPFTPARVRPDSARVELGRILFFDRRLSADGTTSCATCHDPNKGWSDGLARARGKGGKQLRRNTPSVINVDGRGPMFWDGRAATAEEQALGPIQNRDEMGRDLSSLIRDLEDVPEYVIRFRRAFGNPDITGPRIASALADFERTLVSAGAPLDRYLSGDSTALSPAAVRGLQIFTGKGRCVRCHYGPQLTDAGFHNIGVGTLATDKGRYEVMPLAISKGAFKTPPLRDVELTAPYFHDGSAATLREVVAHYNRGEKKENLDADIVPLGLGADEEGDLVEFMRALTGASPHVDPPRVPVSASRSGRFHALPVIMKVADKNLRRIVPSSAITDPERAAEARTAVAELTAAIEQIPAFFPRSTRRPGEGDLDELVGGLAIALGDLGGSLAAHKADRTAAFYDDVRAHCERCHETYRWSRERDTHRR